MHFKMCIMCSCVPILALHLIYVQCSFSQLSVIRDLFLSINCSRFLKIIISCTRWKINLSLIESADWWGNPKREVYLTTRAQGNKRRNFQIFSSRATIFLVKEGEIFLSSLLAQTKCVYAREKEIEIFKEKFQSTFELIKMWR